MITYDFDKKQITTKKEIILIFHRRLFFKYYELISSCTP
jgi:hypothetical protein